MQLRPGQYLAAGLVVRAFYHCLESAFCYRRLLSARRVSARNLASDQVDLDVTIALPVYMRASIVFETLEHFTTLAGAPGCRAEIVVITTEREGPLHANPTAIETLRYMHEHPERGVQLFHSYRQPYGKAAQLNDWLGQHAEASPRRWILVYDFDGRPELRALSLFSASVAAQPGAEVFQQVAISDPRRSPTSLITRLESYSNVFRTFGIEHRLIARRATFTAAKGVRRFLSPVIYLVGNGLCIRQDSLTALGGFTEPVDDIPLGYLCSLRGLAIASSPVIVRQEAYPSVARMRSSQALIWRGVMTARSIRAQELARSSQTANAAQTGLATMRATYAGYAWPLAPIAAVVWCALPGHCRWPAIIACWAQSALPLLCGLILYNSAVSWPGADGSQGGHSVSSRSLWEVLAILTFAPARSAARLGAPWQVILGRVAGSRS